MKKFLYLAFVLFVFVFLFTFGGADNVDACTVKKDTCDESCTGGTVGANGDTTGGTTKGLVPCGKAFGRNYTCSANNNSLGTVRSDSAEDAKELCKTTFPAFGNGTNQTATAVEGADNQTPKFACRCELYHVFTLGRNIYVFIVWTLAVPLAGLLIVLGGTLLLLSGASTKVHDLGKSMLWGAAWGIGLIFCSYLIVGVIMMALGVPGAWNVF